MPTKKFFCLFLFESTFTSFFKKQNSRNQGFSYYFCHLIEDPDPSLWLTDLDPGASDPDPQNCKKVIHMVFCGIFAWRGCGSPCGYICSAPVTWTVDTYHCREACRDPDNLYWLASSLVGRLILIRRTWVRIKYSNCCKVYNGQGLPHWLAPKICPTYQE
jgi:hypothetical protein